MRILSILVFVPFFVVFCFWLLLGAFVRAGIGGFGVGMGFCVFLMPILMFFGRIFFWVMVALFAILGCGCGGSCTFSGILRGVGGCFFAGVYCSPCDSY